MARYSPIAPVHILQELLKQKQLSGYLLLLAHDVLAHPDEYQQLESDMYEQNLDTFVIMDNGVIERGAPVELSELLEAANLVDADVVVGPDVIGDLYATRRLMNEQANTIRMDYPIMFIPQGRNEFDLHACCEFYANTYEEIRSEPLTSYWGVPRWIANELGSRRPMIDIIRRYDPYACIHLLGMSKNISDDLMCSQLMGVIGIDSANPLVMAHNNRVMGGADYVHFDRGNYWADAKVSSIMQHNIEWITHAVSS